MNKKKVNNLAIKLFFRNKKNIIRCVICSIIVFITIIGANIYSTLDNYVSLTLEQSPIARIMLLTDESKKYSLSEIKKITENIQEINDVFDYSLYQIAPNLKALNGKEVNKSIVIQQELKSYPIITEGRNIKKNNEIVCGKDFIPIGDLEFSTVNKKDIMNLSVNDVITINVNKYNGISKVDSVDIDLTVVGFFENNYYAYDNNICFANSSTIRKINELSSDEQENTLPAIFVDKHEDVSKVSSLLSDKGIETLNIFNLDDHLIKSVKYISYIILFVCLIFSAILLLIFQNKMAKERKYNEVLYKIIGYSNHEVLKINLQMDKIFMSFVIILSLLILVIVYVIYKIIIYINPFAFYRFTLSFNIPLIVLSILIVSILFFIKYLKIGAK